MSKRLISIYIVAVLLFSIYDHAQTAVGTPITETESVKQRAQMQRMQRQKM